MVEGETTSDKSGMQDKIKDFVVKHKITISIVIVILVVLIALVATGKIKTPLTEKMLIDQPRTDPQADWSMREEFKKLEKYQQKILNKLGK